MLVAMMMSVKTHYCQAQENVETTARLTISVITDSTGKPLAGAEVQIEGSDGSMQTDSTSQEGIVTFAAMQQRVVYSIRVSSPNYYSEKTTLYLTDTVNDQHIAFRMTKIQHRGTPHPQIVFRRNSVRFSKYSYDALNIFIHFLKGNPGIAIAISGHTAPCEKEKLGQKRAEIARDIIIQQGIDAGRISIDTTLQCETDCEGIQYISNCDFRGKVITKAYLKTLSGKERRNARKSCMHVRFRIVGTDFRK
ncbi:hypothetical protein DSECCO2_637370 [anaerobic digester metagenome]